VGVATVGLQVNQKKVMSNYVTAMGIVVGTQSVCKAIVVYQPAAISLGKDIVLLLES
jgi:hypothetical protein